jgi:hypothetical protein
MPANARHVALAVAVLVLDADLDIRGERGEAEREKEHGDRPLDELEPMPCRGRVGTCETAPFHREAIEADASVQLDRQQQQDIERPQVLAPDPIGGFVRSDAVGTGEHDVQMHRRQEEQREAREYLPEPQRGVFVFHHPHVTAERPELVVVAGELAQRQRCMHHDEANDHRDHD